MKELLAFEKQFASHLKGYDTRSSGVYREDSAVLISEMNDGTEFISDGEEEERAGGKHSVWETKTVDVEHIWLYTWDDFGVPSPASFEVREEERCTVLY